MPGITRLGLTLISAAIGGYVFALVSLPLPWMLGSMCAVATLALVGVPVVSVKRIRPPLATIIGVTLGSSFSVETFEHGMAWLPLTLAVVLSTALMVIVGPLYLRRVARFDYVTGFFAAMPAGVYEMTSQGGLQGGVERKIALVHAVRIFAVVLTVPVVFRLVYGFDATPVSVGGISAGLGFKDAALLTLCAVFGWPLARRLGLPNAPLLGPLLLSVLVHLVGLTETSPPPLLVAVAQVFLGASIGGQFIGASARELSSIAVHSFMLILIMLIICLLVAVGTASLFSLDVPTLLLALAPGGTAEMSFVALALDTDVPAVVAHQLLRVVLIHALAAWLFQVLKGQGR